MDNSINITEYNYFNKIKQLLSCYQFKEIVFFCVGNYKVWYDCFSSQLADQLKRLNLKSYIYGGKDFPIIPENLSEYIEFINKKHPYACIIVVDNLLTFTSDDCGQVVIRNRSSNIAYFSQNLTFGNISLLLKTYPYNNSYEFLERQSKTIQNLVFAIKELNKNGLIE